MSYIDFDHITKEYNSGGSSIFALKDASFSVEKGELAVILGASGAGKTTALNILGGLLHPGKCWWTAQMSPLLANASLPSTDARISVLSFSFTIWCQI